MNKHSMIEPPKNQRINTIHLKTIGTAIFFAILLLGMGIIQARLKEMPQKVIIGLGGLLLLLKVFNEQKLSSVPLYIIMWLCLYNTIFLGVGFIADLINPDDGWIEIDGGKQRTMGINWIWGILAGIIFSPILIWKYHKSQFKNNLVELMFAFSFVIIMSLIYIL